MTIAASIMTAGQLGLEPGVNGQGFLIPYGRTCTFVPGWKGLVDLVARSGRGTVYTGVIFKDQEYTWMDGARRDLIIHNETDLDAPEDITHAFAIGWVKDASMPIIELWSVEKIRKHRDKYNKVGAKHYSFRDWEMYCRKIPLLQVLKYMPASIEVSNAIAISHASESGRMATIENGIVLDTNQEPQDTPVECYLQADFDRNLPAWTKLISEGKKTADQIIATANSKAPLTDEQKAAIGSISCKLAGELTASASQMETINNLAEEMAISQSDILKKFDLGSMADITEAMVPAVLSFINNPMGE